MHANDANRENNSTKARRVLVWGTFDLLHEGHKKFLTEAKKLGDELYVIVVPDAIVFENKNRYPVHSAELRKQNIESTGLANGVFIDSLSEGLRCLEGIKPDIFCCGHDYKQDLVGALSEMVLRREGKIVEVVYLTENYGIHTSDLIKRFSKNGEAHKSKT